MLESSLLEIGDMSRRNAGRAVIVFETYAALIYQATAWKVTSPAEILQPPNRIEAFCYTNIARPVRMHTGIA
jgi:hypothetical protein